MAQQNGSGKIKEGVLPRVRHDALPIAPRGPGRRTFPQWLADTSLMIPALAADSATVQNVVIGDMLGEVDWGKGYAQSVALVEKFHTLGVDDLVDQAMLSVNSAARELAGGSLKRGPITPALHLYAAELVISERSVKTKAAFLKKLFDRCSQLMREYPGQKDVQEKSGNEQCCRKTCQRHKTHAQPEPNEVVRAVFLYGSHGKEKGRYNRETRQRF